MPRVGLRAHAPPAVALGAVREYRRAIDAAGCHVELVSELVQHDVAERLLATAREDGVPGEDDGAAEHRLTDHGATVTDRCARLLEECEGARRRDQRGRIDEDRRDVGEPIVGVIEGEDAGLRSDRDLHLLGELEATAALPGLLGDEHRDALEQAATSDRIEAAGQDDVVVEDCVPVGGNGLREESFATPIAKPTEHGANLRTWLTRATRPIGEVRPRAPRAGRSRGAGPRSAAPGSRACAAGSRPSPAARGPRAGRACRARRHPRSARVARGRA